VIKQPAIRQPAIRQPAIRCRPCSCSDWRAGRPHNGGHCCGDAIKSPSQRHRVSHRRTLRRLPRKLPRRLPRQSVEVRASPSPGKADIDFAVGERFDGVPWAFSRSRLHQFRFGHPRGKRISRPFAPAFVQINFPAESASEVPGRNRRNLPPRANVDPLFSAAKIDTACSTASGVGRITER